MFEDEELASDTDDEDFVPEGEGHDASEEEQSGDEEDRLDKDNITNKHRRGKRKKENTFGGGGPVTSEARDWEKALEEEKKEKEQLEAKQKADDIWASFKSDVGSSKPKQIQAKPRTGMSDLFSTKPSPVTTNSTNTQSSQKSGSRLSSLFDPSPPTSKQPESTEKPKPSKPSLLSSLFSDEPAKDAKSTSESDATASTSTTSTTSTDTSATSGKIAITKVFDFAGEAVEVTKEVDKESDEAKKHLKQQEKTAEKETERKRAAGGGLARVVGNIGKKAKMGCLDKSKLDWNKFVEDEGIKEELSSHNRGKDGYVEKQMFLERADLRQFELEKAVRDKNRKSLMK